MSDPNRLTPTDEEIREMMFVIAKSFGATTDTPGPQTILYSLKLARTAYARGLQRAAEIALEHGRCYCHKLNLPLHDKGCIVSVARLLAREREGEGKES